MNALNSILDTIFAPSVDEQRKKDEILTMAWQAKAAAVVAGGVVGVGILAVAHLTSLLASPILAGLCLLNYAVLSLVCRDVFVAADTFERLVNANAIQRIVRAVSSLLDNGQAAEERMARDVFEDTYILGPMILPGLLDHIRAEHANRQ